MIPPKPRQRDEMKMMGRVSLRPPSRDELIDLIIASPDSIESSLTILDRDLSLGSDREIDLVAADVEGCPVLFLLAKEDESEDTLFLRALDAPIWITDTQPLLERIYTEAEIDWDGRLRILVVGTGFTPELCTRVDNLLGFSTCLIKCQCIEEGGRLGLLCEELAASFCPVDEDFDDPTVPIDDDHDDDPPRRVGSPLEDFSDYDKGSDTSLGEDLEADSAGHEPKGGAAHPIDLDQALEGEDQDDEPLPSVGTPATKHEIVSATQPDPVAAPEPTTASESNTAALNTSLELLDDGERRITALSDRIQAHRASDLVRFLLDGRILAEIRQRDGAVEVLTDPNTTTGPIKNATDFESGLNRIINKFFRLQDKSGPSDAPEDRPTGAKGPDDKKIDGSVEDNQDQFRPATLTEDEIADLFAQDPPDQSKSSGTGGDS